MMMNDPAKHFSCGGPPARIREAWTVYSCKKVKSDAGPIFRSYERCSELTCGVKRRVDRIGDASGKLIAVNCMGEHNHPVQADLDDDFPLQSPLPKAPDLANGSPSGIVLQNASPQLTTIGTAPFTIVDVNDRWLELCGFGRHEVIGRTPEIIQGPRTEPHELAQLMAAMCQLRSFKSKLTNYTKGGSEFVHTVQIEPVDIGGQVMFVATTVSATFLKKTSSNPLLKLMQAHKDSAAAVNENHTPEAVVQKEKLPDASKPQQEENPQEENPQKYPIVQQGRQGRPTDSIAPQEAISATAVLQAVLSADTLVADSVPGPDAARTPHTQEAARTLPQEAAPQEANGLNLLALPSAPQEDNVSVHGSALTACMALANAALAEIGARGGEGTKGRERKRVEQTSNQTEMKKIVAAPRLTRQQWKKYGQKVMKKSAYGEGETIRSYYKCSYEGCMVKKFVDNFTGPDGKVSEKAARFWGKHCHGSDVFCSKTECEQFEDEFRASAPPPQTAPQQTAPQQTTPQQTAPQQIAQDHPQQTAPQQIAQAPAYIPAQYGDNGDKDITPSADDPTIERSKAQSGGNSPLSDESKRQGEERQDSDSSTGTRAQVSGSLERRSSEPRSSTVPPTDSQTQTEDMNLMLRQLAHSIIQRGQQPVQRAQQPDQEGGNGAINTEGGAGDTGNIISQIEKILRSQAAFNEGGDMLHPMLLGMQIALALQPSPPNK